MDQLKYDSLYSGLVSINKSLGGTQSMPDSEYGAMIDLMETLSGQPVGESGDAYDAVSTVATMAENGELPIQMKLDSVDVDITANGRYEYQPSAYGLDGFSRFTANVNVPTGGGNKVDVGELGLKFGGSTFSTVPDVFDFSKVTDTSNMFDKCKNLVDIPSDFNFAGIVNGSYAFRGCTKMTGIPRDIYLTNAVVADQMFAQTGITEVVNFSAPLVEEYADFFRACPNLTSINGLSINKATIAYQMFMNCDSLRTIQNFSMPNVTDIERMFMGCDSLESIPVFDTSNVTSANYAFYSCTSLQHIPSMNLSKVSDLYNTFWGSTNLQSIGEIDLSGLTQNIALFGDNMEFLTDLGGFPGLSIGFEQGYGLDRCPNLSKTSIENVVNNLKDISSTGTIQTLYLSTSAQDKVDEQITSTATTKGWAIAFL